MWDPDEITRYVLEDPSDRLEPGMLVVSRECEMTLDTTALILRIDDENETMCYYVDGFGMLRDINISAFCKAWLLDGKPTITRSQNETG